MSLVTIYCYAPYTREFARACSAIIASFKNCNMVLVLYVMCTKNFMCVDCNFLTHIAIVIAVIVIIGSRHVMSTVVLTRVNTTDCMHTSVYPCIPMYI